MVIAIMPPCFLSKSRVSKCWIDIEIGIHRKGTHENSKKKCVEAQSCCVEAHSHCVEAHCHCVEAHSHCVRRFRME